MTQLPDWYYVCLINSELISLYVDNFVNNTSHFQINDARQLPIIIPSPEILMELQNLCQKSIEIKKSSFSSLLAFALEEEKLDELQAQLNQKILRLYRI